VHGVTEGGEAGGLHCSRLGDGWDVVFRGKDGDEISGGGWRPRRREKGKRRLVAGKPGRRS